MDVSDDTTACIQKLLLKVYQNKESPKKKVKLVIPKEETPGEPISNLDFRTGPEFNELRRTLDVKVQEIRNLAESNIRLTQEIAALKVEMELIQSQVESIQLYALKMPVP